MESKNDYTPVSSFHYVTHSIVIAKEVAKCIDVKEHSRSLRSNHVIFPIMKLQAHVANTKNIIAKQWELITERTSSMLCNGFMIFKSREKKKEGRKSRE